MRTVGIFRHYIELIVSSILRAKSSVVLADWATNRWCSSAVMSAVCVGVNGTGRALGSLLAIDKLWGGMYSVRPLVESIRRQGVLRTRGRQATVYIRGKNYDQANETE